MTAARALMMWFALAAATLLTAQPRNLEIYWIDVEGGAATLIVAPSGQSLLIDAGWLAANGRDAGRIMDAAKAAHISQIDGLVVSHFHMDHVGGVPALAKLIPIRRFYDHGESIEASEPRGAQIYDAYKAVAKDKRISVKVGDRIPLSGVNAAVVSSNGDVISKPVGSAAPNEFCKGAQDKAPDKTENSRSVGILLTYGKFTFLDLGDLTWDKEMQLACPVNKLGTVSVFQTTHHGFSNGASGNPALIWALKPQVVVVNDGARKGFDEAAYETLSKIPGVQDIWQIHQSLTNDAAHNTNKAQIANLEEGPADQGHWIKLSAAKDGSFKVINSRGNFSKSYMAR